MIRREPTMVALSDLDVQDIRDMMAKSKAKAEAEAASNSGDNASQAQKPKPKEAALSIADDVLIRRRRDRIGLR